MANIAVSHHSVRLALVRNVHALVSCLLLVAALVAPVMSVDVARASGPAVEGLEESTSLVTVLGHGVQVIVDGHVTPALLLSVAGAGLLVSTAWLVLAAVVRARGHLDATGRMLWASVALGACCGVTLLVAGTLVRQDSASVTLGPPAAVLVALAAWVALRPGLLGVRGGPAR